jgi:Zn-finger nucleic acid-binding protein
MDMPVARAHYDPAMAMTCPKCGGELVELERSGIRIDACRNCRGVFLDRGELEQLVERERRVVAGVDDDEADFVREMTGHGKPGHKPERSYGLDPRTAEKIYGDYRTHRKHKKRKSFLDELFD